MKQFRHLCQVLIAFAVISFLIANAQLSQAGELQKEMGRIAAQIKKFLDGRGEVRVTLGEFTGPPGLQANNGPGLDMLLRQEFKQLGISLARVSNYSITGVCLAVKDKQTGIISIKVTLRITDGLGDVAAEMSAILRGTDDVARMTGSTVSLPPKGTRQDRHERLQDRIRNPNVHIDGTRIAASASSPFAVELLVLGGKDRSVARQPTIKDGQAFVDIKRNQIYEVRLHNKSKSEAAVTLTIDGLDVFTFTDVRQPADGKPRYSHYIVPANSNMTIKGWHKTNKEAISFLVTEYGKGAASSKHMARGKIGILTVTFAHAWERNKPPPGIPYSRTAGNETGFGPSRHDNLREVRRTIDVVRDVVSVRYTR